VKTQLGYRQAIEQVISQNINYTNLIAELTLESINNSFQQWLDSVVPPVSTNKKSAQD
jgi:hypothetical protein